MVIQYYGVSCFKISTKIDNQEVSLVTDPYSAKIGKLPRNFSADIVTVSRKTHDHHNNTAAIKSDHFLIEHPGEYEVRSISIYGLPASHEKKEAKGYHKNTMFHLTMDGVRVAHLGGLREPMTDEQLSQLGDVDVLMIPVGGGDVMDPAVAADLVSKIEPRAIIPMYYKMKGLSFKASSVDGFVKEVGLKSQELDKWKVQKKDLSPEETQLIILNHA